MSQDESRSYPSSLGVPVVHDLAARRFLMQVDGQDCVIDYRLDAGVMAITHTLVPSAVGGRGIAAELTRIALLAAREQGWRVEAECSYAQRYIERHPEAVA